MKNLLRVIILSAACLQSFYASAESKEISFTEPQYTSVTEAMKDAGNLTTCNFLGAAGCAEWLYSSVDENLYKAVGKMTTAEIEQETLIAGKVKEGNIYSLNTIMLVMATIFSTVIAGVFAFSGITDKMYKTKNIKQIAWPATALCLAFAFIIYVDLGFAVKQETISFTQKYAARSIGYGYKILNTVYKNSVINDKIYLEPFPTPDFSYKTLDMLHFRDYVMCLKANQVNSFNLNLNADDDFTMRETQVKNGCGAVATFGQNKEIGRLVEEYNLSAKDIDSTIEQANKTAITKLVSFTNAELNSIVSGFKSNDDSLRNKAYIDYYKLPARMSEVLLRAVADMEPDKNLAGRQKLMCDFFGSKVSRPFFKVSELLEKQNKLSECVSSNKSKSITEYVAAAYLERQIYSTPYYYQKGVFFAATNLLESHKEVMQNYKTIARNFSFKFFLVDTDTKDYSNTAANNVFTISVPINTRFDFDLENYEELLRNYVNETEKTIGTDKTRRSSLELIKSDTSGIFGFTQYKECMRFYNFNTISPSGFPCGDFYSNTQTLGNNITKFSMQAVLALGSSKLTQYGVKRFKVKGAAQNAVLQLTAKTTAAVGVNELTDLMNDEITGDPFSSIDADVYFKSEIAWLMGAQMFLKAEVFDPFISGLQQVTFWFGVGLKLIPYTIMFVMIGTLLGAFTYAFTTLGVINGLAYNYLKSSSVYNNVGIEKLAAFYIRWIAYFAILCVGWYFIKEVIPVVISIKLNPDDIDKIKNIPEGITDLYSVIDNVFSSCVYVFLLSRISLRAIYDAFRSSERHDMIATGKAYEELKENADSLVSSKINKQD
ncbi:transcriptional regulator, Cro/CI family [Pseudomonas syringae pv. broussonetiae]|uniref:Uncharacterized protein n=2 Tax=Pseudomonas savastanoi TaxID=29438 RepID=A0A3M5JEX4_PSESS|nr:hypothetical protein [Pseudomonas savastanoi]KPW62898.1 transcriptional regulator, Cro/CI family [Pseudomonas syringae pv. broussonetiae]RMT21955.1 hypothetical protein ALP51_00889 [Pseudomonas savastanoi]